jgi:hypothetical protein
VDIEFGQTVSMARFIPVVALIAGLAVAPLALSADQGRVASHCSSSGDVCYGIFKSDLGAVRFQLTLAAKYFARYRICVRPLGQTATCKRFRVRKVGANWGGKVSWQKNFPVRGPRRYRVTWSQHGHRLGPTLSFTLPAPTV